MYFVIDSQKRDTTNYPNTSSFKYRSTRIYSNVKKTKLISAQLMSSDYIINSNNNTLSIRISSTNFTCTLTKGSWSASSYAGILQADMNRLSSWNADPVLSFTVTYDSGNGKFTIGASGNFLINFDVSTKLAVKLGFKKIQTVTLGIEHISDNVAQFFNSRYYDIRIYELMRDSSENLNNCFARVYNNVQPFELIDYQSHRDYQNIEHNMCNMKIFPQDLKIEIYDENGDLVDNNNSEFILVISLC